jgi:hypothetical protein
MCTHFLHFIHPSTPCPCYLQLPTDASPPSEQDLFCPHDLWFYRIKKKNVIFLLVWDKGSYTWSFLVIFPNPNWRVTFFIDKKNEREPIKFYHNSSSFVLFCHLTYFLFIHFFLYFLSFYLHIIYSSNLACSEFFYVFPFCNQALTTDVFYNSFYTSSVSLKQQLIQVSSLIWGHTINKTRTWSANTSHIMKNR